MILTRSHRTWCKFWRERNIYEFQFPYLNIKCRVLPHLQCEDVVLGLDENTHAVFVSTDIAPSVIEHYLAEEQVNGEAQHLNTSTLRCFHSLCTIKWGITRGQSRASRQSNWEAITRVPCEVRLNFSENTAQPSRVSCTRHPFYVFQLAESIFWWIKLQFNDVPCNIIDCCKRGL